MFDSSGRKILIGVVTGTLLSTAIASVLAAEDIQTHRLLDSQGQPVKTVRPNECVYTPNTPNQPPRLFEECGDIMDRDKDGVPDNEDQCPDNTPEEIAQGVYDDKEPPRNPKNRKPQRACDKIGCPIDTDGDSVPDFRDQCPGTSAEYEIQPPNCAKHDCVNTDGCVPDTDADGVPDCKDACPNTAPGTKVRADGCSEVETKLIDKTMNAKTLFDFNKAILKPEGRQEIDNLLAEINRLQNWTRIEVIGHTDPVGKDAYNQKLSEQRAKAVFDHLLNQGVPAGKITSIGMGESRLVERLPGESEKDWHARCRRVEVLVYGQEQVQRTQP